MAGLSGEGPVTLLAPPILAGIWTVNKYSCDDLGQAGAIKLRKMESVGGLAYAICVLDETPEHKKNQVNVK